MGVTARLPGLRGRVSNATRETIWGYVFIAPWLAGFIAFSLIPIAVILYLGFTDYDIMSKATWSGLANYKEMLFEDRLAKLSIYNTVYYVLLRVPIHLALAFGLALLVKSKKPGIPFFRTAFYVPAVVPMVGMAVAWAWILSPLWGVFNGYLQMGGIHGQNWLGNEVYAKASLVVISLFDVGVMMMIFLAGLQNIPVHLYEAADMDGANGLQRLIHVTIPMMTPTIFLNLVMDIINSFQVVTYALLLTQGGPLNSTLFLVLYIYRSAFQQFEMGYASALATLLFIIIVVLTLPIFWSSDRWVQYEQV